MLRSLSLLAALLFLIPASAQGAQITGDPLLIAADDNGRLGVAFAGARTTEFCCTSVDSETGQVTTGNAGFTVTVLDPNGGSQDFGVRGQTLTLTSPPTVSGSGRGDDPFKLRTTWIATGSAEQQLFELRQELTYVNGAQSFDARYDVVSLADGGLLFRAAMGADLTGGGSDSGTGLFEPGPPRFVGGLNPGSGAIAGLSELTPWDGYEEGQYSDVLSRASGDPRQGQNLNDTIEPTTVDNGVAVQWDAHTASPLPPGATASFSSSWRFPRSFSLTPEVASASTGDTAPFEASVGDTQGNPRAGVPIRWTVSGSNSASGTSTTGADGKALFEYVGGNPGFDTVSAYADLNGNAQRDEGEPEREARITWTGLEAPQFGEEVNLKPVSGRVLVKLPRNANVRGKWAHAAQSRFVRLTSATQVPVGAELDTKRGRVQLTSSSAFSPSGAPSAPVQTSQFYSGRFKVLQSRRERGMTEVRLTETMKCKRNARGQLVSARVRSRKLWGRGKGRFRTRGRNSSATVRGTTWFTKDSCAKTTTSVKEGTVIVKDFGKRRNVTIKAGKRYIARAKVVKRRR